jgi:hypothetical protein
VGWYLFIIDWAGWLGPTATTRAWSSSCKRSKADTKPALGSIEGAATQETKAKPAGLGRRETWPVKVQKFYMYLSNIYIYTHMHM